MKLIEGILICVALGIGGRIVEGLAKLEGHFSTLFF